MMRATAFWWQPKPSAAALALWPAAAIYGRAAAYRLELDAFLRRLQGGDGDIVSGADGVRALEIADACDRSLRTRTTVALEARA